MICRTIFLFHEGEMCITFVVEFSREPKCFVFSTNKVLKERWRDRKKERNKDILMIDR